MRKKSRALRGAVFLFAVAWMLGVLPGAFPAHVGPAAFRASAASEETTELYAENFDGYADHAAARRGMAQFWFMEDSNTWGREDGFTIRDEGDGKAFRMCWLGGRLLLSEGIDMPDAYEIRFRMQGDTTSGGSGFFFIHTEKMREIDRIYDASTGSVRDAVPADSPYITIYESDADAGSGFTSVGYSGIFLTLRGSKVCLGVKTREAVDGTHVKGIGNLCLTADLPGGKDTSKTFCSVRIREENHAVAVYVDDVHMATVELSGEQDGYYTKAVIRHADGTEAASTDRALVTTENLFGFSTRAAYLVLDDIQITALSKVAKRHTLPIYDVGAEKTGVVPLYGQEDQVGFQFTVGDNDACESIRFIQMATSGAVSGHSFRFSVFRWADTYDDTIFGDPVFDTVVKEHRDNQDCLVTFPEPLRPGTYLALVWECVNGLQADGTTVGYTCIWRHELPDDDSVVVWINGNEANYGLWADCVILENGYPGVSAEDFTPAPATDVPATETEDPGQATQTPAGSEAPADSTPAGSGATQNPAATRPAASHALQSDGDNSAGLWIAIAVCVLAVGAAVAIILILLRRRNKK